MAEYMMKASDYIVEYLIKLGVTDIFGYPGGMVTHLMDSLSKYENKIKSHLTYHEQGAAFAACGYSQTSGNIGVAYATSGPGATNLITGICNAYFDSIPVLFITGQVNTFESKGEMNVRQRGFQETDIVSMVSGVTKYASKVEDANMLRWELEYAVSQAIHGRKGPVLLDIPMNIFSEDVIPGKLPSYTEEIMTEDIDFSCLNRYLEQSDRPVMLVGNGVKIAGVVDEIRKLSRRTAIPMVSTMVAVDTIDEEEKHFGFIGAYGSRTANFIVAKSDLVITLGARLDVRQVGAKRENFALGAKIVRIDVDPGELEYKVHEDEVHICADLKQVVKYLVDNSPSKKYIEWNETCRKIKSKLQGIDNRRPNNIIKKLSEYIPDNAIITTDVGQNQVWVAQSLKIKSNQRVFFSGGHGAMGYSLPAAIGCAFASGKTVYSFNGDGGIQMNIQELQTIAREQIPVKVVLLNNSALGMIRHFQEMYFGDNYYHTLPSGGYTVPDFEAIAKAYKIPYHLVEVDDDIDANLFGVDGPEFIEVKLNEPTYVFPKLEFGKLNHDQEPLLDREIFEELMAL